MIELTKFERKYAKRMAKNNISINGICRAIKRRREANSFKEMREVVAEAIDVFNKREKT
jgi:hypothetical protein